MAHVAILFLRERPAIHSVFAKAFARAGPTATHASRRNVMSRCSCRSEPDWRSLWRQVIAILLLISLTSCATLSSHKFAMPDNSWKVRAGVFAYRTAQTTIAGDVVVRFSNDGDFEFTLSKGPGVTLLTIRQDATFAELKGPLA